MKSMGSSCSFGFFGIHGNLFYALNCDEQVNNDAFNDAYTIILVFGFRRQIEANSNQ